MIYNFNDTEYILINVPFVESHKKRLDATLKKYECIIQDFEIMRNNLTIFNFLLGNTKIKISVLVPTKHIKQFTDEVFK